MGKSSSKSDKRQSHFKPVKLSSLGTNSDWALANLPAVRMAQVIVSKSEGELEVAVRGLLETDEGTPLFELLRELDSVGGHLKAICEVMRMADARVILTLARIDDSLSLIRRASQ